MTRLRSLLALGALLLLAACGGDGVDGSNSVALPTTGASPTPVNNTVTVTVDQGPAGLTGDGVNYNIPYVSVTICQPGTTSNCQTIDHVTVDTGSIGLRILATAIKSSLLPYLPVQTDTTNSSVGECYTYVEGYAFGTVRSADFYIGGESVAAMPFQVVGDIATVPDSCSAGGGLNLNTVQNLRSNGILGIGVSPTDCGVFCTVDGGYAAATYYRCPNLSCSSIIGRASSTVVPFQQLPNPVAAFAVDNNGSILSLPTVAASGQPNVTGTLYFGIGTQSNNALGSATVLNVSPSSSPYGPGLLTAVYNGQTLTESFLDSGSNSYFFVDNALAGCQDANYTGYYCPSSAMQLTPTIKGINGATASGAISLQNAQTLLTTGDAALPGIGANPGAITYLDAYPNSFDFGLPFFYGKSVYTAIEGRSAGGVAGPYVAF